MKRRERILAVVASAVLVLAVVDLLVLGPLAGVWQRLKADLTARRAELVAARELIKRDDALRSRYRRLAARVEGDVGVRESRFLAFLRTSAERAGLEIATEKPSRRSHGRRGSGSLRSTESAVGLTFTCSMEALVRFLVELAAGEEAVRVTKLDVTSLDPAGRSLKVSLGLTTLALPAAEEPAPEAAAGRTGRASTTAAGPREALGKVGDRTL